MPGCEILLKPAGGALSVRVVLGGIVAADEKSIEPSIPGPRAVVQGRARTKQVQVQVQVQRGSKGVSGLMMVGCVSLLVLLLALALALVATLGCTDEVSQCAEGAGIAQLLPVGLWNTARVVATRILRGERKKY